MNVGAARPSTLLAFLVTVLCGAACGGGDVKLDCAAYSNHQTCSGRPEPTAQDCSCQDAISRDEAKAHINDCGSEATCSAVMSCEAGDPALPPRAIDSRIANSCGAYAVRCSLDSMTECGTWSPSATFPNGLQIFLNEELLSRIATCYEDSACLGPNQCFTTNAPASCS